MKRLIILLLFLPFFSISQDYKNYRGVQMCIAIQQSNAFSSNIEAEEALDMIMDVSGLNKNFILQPCEGINNALAIRFKNERYIIYDPEFMSKVDGIDKWRNLTILSHEVAHHLNNHPVEIEIAKNFERRTYETRKKQELEADEFAGFIMHKLDAPIDEVIKAISSISFDGDDTYRTHPNREKRVNAVKQGYKRSGYNENNVVTYWEQIKKMFLTKTETKKEDVKPSKNTTSIWEKIKKMFLTKTETNKEDVKPSKKTTSTKTSSKKTFKYTTRDFYIDNFNKSPDYGNYVDVNSSYFTPDILYSRTTEVLDAVGNKRYGKLYEGLSYVNRRMQLESGVMATEYGHRAEINFYLGNYRDALSDVNKEISLRNDIWMIKYTLKLRSKIKYMLRDYIGAINDLEEHYNYFIKKETNCPIDTYYWFIVYHLAMNDYSNADFYLGKVNAYPSYNKWCGTGTINNIKSRANKLQPYIN